MTFSVTPLPSDSLVQILNMMPVSTLVIDEELRVLYLNQAAQALMAERPPWLKVERCGDALLCVNALREGACCGQTEDCEDCVVRRIVLEACREQCLATGRALISRHDGAEERYLHALVRAQGFECEGLHLAALLVQDIPELVESTRVLRMCAWCHKVNVEDDVWEELPSFLDRQLSLGVSHGMCLECSQRWREGRPTGPHSLS